VRVTLLLIAINVVVYGAMVATAPAGARLEFTEDHLIAFGGVYAERVRDGELWRLVAAMFVHATPSHLAWNMVSLWFLGRTLEPRYAAVRFLVLYLVTGLVGDLLTLVWLWDTDIVAIGASGAVCGLIGAGAGSGLRMGERGRYFRNSMLAWGVLVLVNGFTYQTNNVAHASGLLAGVLLVLVFGRRGAAALVPRGRVGSLEGLLEEERPACPACGARNPAGSAYCGRCGAALATRVAPPG
jgi:rhomboid protease GluP